MIVTFVGNQFNRNNLGVLQFSSVTVYNLLVPHNEIRTYIMNHYLNFENFIMKNVCFVFNPKRNFSFDSRYNRFHIIFYTNFLIMFNTKFSHYINLVFSFNLSTIFIHFYHKRMWYKDKDLFILYFTYNNTFIYSDLYCIIYWIYYFDHFNMSIHNNNTKAGIFFSFTFFSSHSFNKLDSIY